MPRRHSEIENDVVITTMSWTVKAYVAPNSLTTAEKYGPREDNARACGEGFHLDLDKQNLPSDLTRFRFSRRTFFPVEYFYDK